VSRAKAGLAGDLARAFRGPRNKQHPPLEPLHADAADRRGASFTDVKAPSCAGIVTPSKNQAEE
jgi:hypothetical protein